MGISYSAWLRVGFSFTAEDFLKPFKHVVTPERTETKKVFCRDTGKELEPEIKKIPAVIEHRFNGRTVEGWGAEDGSLAAALAMHLDCGVDYYGSYPSGEMYYAVYVPASWHTSQPGQGSLDDYKCDVSGGLLFDEVCGLKKQVGKLMRELIKLGLDPHEPMILNCWSAG